MSKKNNAGDFTIPDFKLCYRAIAIKTAWYRKKNRYKDQWNRIKVPDVSLCRYAHLIFFTKALKTCDGEKLASSTNIAGNTEYLPAENGK
jgi:hypothetical protein